MHFFRWPLLCFVFFFLLSEPATAKIQFKGFACFLLLPESSQENKAVPFHYPLQEGQSFKIAVRPLNKEPIKIMAFRAMTSFGLFPIEFSYNKNQNYYVFPKDDIYFVYRQDTQRDQLLIVATKYTKPKKNTRRSLLLLTYLRPIPKTTPPTIRPSTSPLLLTIPKTTPSTTIHPQQKQEKPYSQPYTDAPRDARLFRSHYFPMSMIIDIHRIGHGRPSKNEPMK